MRYPNVDERNAAMRLLHRAERNDAYLSATEHDLLCRLAFAGVVGDPLSTDELAQAWSIIGSHEERDPFDSAPPLKVTADAYDAVDRARRRVRRSIERMLVRYLLFTAAGAAIVAIGVWLIAGARLAAFRAL